MRAALGLRQLEPSTVGVWVRAGALAITLGLLVGGCAESHHTPPGLEADEVEVGPDGTSGVVAFDVPAAARSVTVVVEGAPAAIYALTSFRLADGIEHIAPVDPPALRTSYPRVVSHEAGHALGLPHPDDSTATGDRVEDAFDDTTAFDDTFMGSALLGGPLPERSLRVSPQQTFALTRSALLE